MKAYGQGDVAFVAVPPDVRWWLCPTVTMLLTVKGYALKWGAAP